MKMSETNQPPKIPPNMILFVSQQNTFCRAHTQNATSWGKTDASDMSQQDASTNRPSHNTNVPEGFITIINNHALLGTKRASRGSKTLCCLELTKDSCCKVNQEKHGAPAMPHRDLGTSQIYIYIYVRIYETYIYTHRCVYK